MKITDSPPNDINEENDSRLCSILNAYASVAVVSYKCPLSCLITPINTDLNISL